MLFWIESKASAVVLLAVLGYRLVHSRVLYRPVAALRVQRRCAGSCKVPF